MDAISGPQGSVSVDMVVEGVFRVEGQIEAPFPDVRVYTERKEGKVAAILQMRYFGWGAGKVWLTVLWELLDLKIGEVCSELWFRQ